MMKKIAIHGFGRIGRSALRVALQRGLFTPAAISDIKDVSTLAALLLGVILVNGITEEVLHRGFVFGHLQQEYSFVQTAILSALLFAGQHLYLVFSIGWTAGLASVLLALLLTFPLVTSFARGGNSLGGPAILHTSSNAPMLILALPPSFAASILVTYMGVVLVSNYLVFVLYRLLPRPTLKAMLR